MLTELDLTEHVLRLMALAEALFDADRPAEAVRLIDEAVEVITAEMGRPTLH